MAKGSSGGSRAFSLLALLLFGLVAARLVIADHPPNPSDAFFCLAFTVVVALAFRLDRPVALPAPFGSAALLTFALLGSTAGSWHPYVSWLSLPTALGAIAAFLAVTALRRSARQPALFAVLVGAAFSSGAAVVQRFITWPDALARQEELGLGPLEVERLESARPLGLSLSPDLMGSLALAGAVAGIALSSSRNLLVKVPAILLGGLCVVALALSRSAGAALAAGVFIALWAFIVVVRGLRGPAALAAVGAAITVPAVLVAAFGRGLDQLSRSAGERLANWQVGFDALLEQPFTGVGFARFAPAYLAERTPDTNITLYAHSHFVQSLVEGGVLLGGLLSAVPLLGVLVLLLKRVSGRPDRSRDVVLAGVGALLLRAAYDYDLQIAANATCFAVLLAVAWVDAQKEGPVFTEGVLPATARRRTWLASVLLLSLLVAAGSAAALSTWRDEVLAPFAAGQPPTAAEVERLRDYLARAPSDPRADVVMARLLTGTLLRCGADCGEAESRARAFLDEERAHPPAAVPILEAVLAARANDVETMERAFAEALAIDPGSPDAHGLRLRFARERGDPRAVKYEREAERWKVSERLKPRGR